MIVFKAADLLWATRIKQTAESLGVPCRPTRTAQMLADRLSDSDVRAFIADLSAEEESLELIRQAVASDVRVLAFGPHVRKDLFQAARDAGAAEVVPNGAFDAGLQDILLGLEGRG
ncbi:MAG: hypothetical protein AAGB51_02250 [Planctomycetota bacterium]